MKRGLVVLLALAMLPIPAPAQDGDPAQDWPPWFDESLKMRVPVTLQTPSPGYPDGWSGPRMVAHELDVTQALIDAGWPLDSATGLPQRFTIDLDSIRVVPLGSEEPVSHLSWDGAILSERGSHPAGHRIVTVAWMAEEEQSSYHIYFDRSEDDAHDPLPRDPVSEQQMLQLLAGPGTGHELYGVVKGSVTLFIASGFATTVKAERLTSQGWSAISGCHGQSISGSASSWLLCSENFGDEPRPIRVQADRPVTGYTWTSPQADENARFLPLGGATGPYADTRLLAPASQGDPTPVDLMALAPCDGGNCQAFYGTGGVSVAVDQATRIEIRRPTTIFSNGPIIGWIPGRGPSPMPLVVDENVTSGAMSIPASGGNILLASGDRNARVQVFNDEGDELPIKQLIQGTTARPEHDHAGGLWRNLPGSSGTGLKMQTQGELFWPSVWNPAPGARQLEPTPTGAVGLLGPADEGSVRVAGVAIAGKASIGASIEGQRLDVKDTISESRAYGSADDEIPTTGGLAEAWVEGDPRLLAAFALYDGDNIATGPMAAHLRPMSVTPGQPQVIGPIFDIDIDPESKISGPGEVLVFDVEGRGLVRSADGSADDLEVSLKVEASSSLDDAPDIDVELEKARATLPRTTPEPLTRLTVTVPSVIEPGQKPVYTIVVSGTPIDGGDTIEATASIQVVAQREISLTFEDGSSLADLETADDGTVKQTLILENKGTDDEPVALDVTFPDADGWTIELTEERTGDPVNQVELAPGEQRRLTLDVTAETEGPLILNAKVTAQSLLDASVADDATARIAHGISTDLRFQILPDLVSLHRGGQTTVNLSMENEGSPVSVRVAPEELDDLVIEASEGPVNLGEPGSGASTETVPLNVTVGNQAPLGGVLVATIGLEVRVGSLEPISELLTVRVRVIPQHGLEPTGSVEVLPGIKQATTLDVRASGDTDEAVELSLREAPAGWRIDLPERLEVPQNTSAPLRMNITTPPGTEPGSEQLRVVAHPADGSEPIIIPFRVDVEKSPAYNLSVPANQEIALGETRAFQLTVENLGNEGGNLTVESSSELVNLALQPASLAIAPGETRTVTVEFTGAQEGNETVAFTAEPGGQASSKVTVGHVAFSVELVSMTPASPEQGEPLRVVARVANSGTVTARDVDIALMSEGTRIQSERIGRLSPGSEATISIRSAEIPSTEDLRLVVDPDNRYTQDTSDDDVSLAQQDTPMLPMALVMLSIALVARARRRS